MSAEHVMGMWVWCVCGGRGRGGVQLYGGCMSADGLIN